MIGTTGTGFNAYLEGKTTGNTHCCTYFKAKIIVNNDFDAYSNACSKGKIMGNADFGAYFKGKISGFSLFRSDFFFGSKTFFFAKKKVGPRKKSTLILNIGGYILI